MLAVLIPPSKVFNCTTLLKEILLQREVPKSETQFPTFLCIPEQVTMKYIIAEISGQFEHLFVAMQVLRWSCISIEWTLSPQLSHS